MVWSHLALFLNPCKYELKQKSGVTVVVPLCEGTTKNIDTTISAPTTSEQQNVLQIMYLLDQFGVGDLFYHELAMLSPPLP